VCLQTALAQSLPSIAEISAELAGKVAALHLARTPQNPD